MGWLPSIMEVLVEGEAIYADQRPRQFMTIRVVIARDAEAAFRKAVALIRRQLDTRSIDPDSYRFSVDRCQLAALPDLWAGFNSAFIWIADASDDQPKAE